VICAKSGFFRAACSTRWLEGREKVVRLPEVMAKVFQVYVDWAYTGNLILGAAATFSPGKRPTCRGLVDLYLLGDVLDDVKLRNKAMQLLNAHVAAHLSPGFATICHVWENTPPSSILRKWMVEVTIMKLKSESFAENAGNYPADYVVQVATTLLHRTKGFTPQKMIERLSSPEFFEPESDASASDV
jgi:hypothetical protein